MLRFFFFCIELAENKIEAEQKEAAAAAAPIGKKSTKRNQVWVHRSCHAKWREKTNPVYAKIYNFKCYGAP